MSIATLLNTPCTIVRRSEDGTVDSYGNEIPDETLATSTCSLQQTRRDEPSSAGEVSVTTWTLFLPTGTPLDTNDGVLIGDAEYEVIGQPWDATEGSPAIHHVEATVRKVAGASDVS